MRSVGDDLRRELRERVLVMTPGERIALTARLAESDLDLFCSVRRIPRDEGRRLLAGIRHVGRRPSRSAQGTD